MKWESLTPAGVRRHTSSAAAAYAADDAADGGGSWCRLEGRADGECVVYAGGVDPESLEGDDWDEWSAAYCAVRYAAAGHAGEVGDGRALVVGTLAECRHAIRAAGATGGRWHGIPADGDVEAWHERKREGCGGWAIRPVE